MCIRDSGRMPDHENRAHESRRDAKSTHRQKGTSPCTPPGSSLGSGVSGGGSTGTGSVGLGRRGTTGRGPGRATIDAVAEALAVTDGDAGAEPASTAVGPAVGAAAVGAEAVGSDVSARIAVAGADSAEGLGLRTSSTAAPNATTDTAATMIAVRWLSTGASGSDIVSTGAPVLSCLLYTSPSPRD